jgi:hypothetical protein
VLFIAEMLYSKVTILVLENMMEFQLNNVMMEITLAVMDAQNNCTIETGWTCVNVLKNLTLEIPAFISVCTKNPTTGGRSNSS